MSQSQLLEGVSHVVGIISEGGVDDDLKFWASHFYSNHWYEHSSLRCLRGH